jgi:hypothetical protein
VPGLDVSCIFTSAAGSLWAYIGPGADLSLISYALALLAFAGTAFSAIFLWPIYALIRKIRGDKGKPAPEAAPEPAAQAVPGEANAESRTGA